MTNSTIKHYIRVAWKENLMEVTDNSANKNRSDNSLVVTVEYTDNKVTAYAIFENNRCNFGACLCEAGVK